MTAEFEKRLREFTRRPLPLWVIDLAAEAARIEREECAEAVLSDDINQCTACRMHAALCIRERGVK